MSYKIISADQQLEAQNLVWLIYGEPGIGKTSLSFTAENPLLEDFDGGAHRAVNRQNIIRIDSWEDAVSFHKSQDFTDLEPKTLIFDTGGTLLDKYMANYVKTIDKSYKQRGGELTLKGYGAMKSLFKQFVDEMKSFNIDLIFVCHTETIQEGDELKRRPKMTGGSYEILIQEADMVGYMESQNNKRTIDFNPTDRHIGKNTAEFQKLNVPHYSDEKFTTFMADLSQQTKDKIKSVTEEQRQVIDTLNELREKLKQCNTVNEVLDVYNETSEMSKVIRIQFQKNVNDRVSELISEIETNDQANEILSILLDSEINLTQAKRALNKKAESLSLVYNKEKKTFENKQ